MFLNDVALDLSQQALDRKIVLVYDYYVGLCDVMGFGK
jgi:hypothetical protein